MFRYIFILMFVVGMIAWSLEAFGGAPITCTSDNLECDATIKCVCEKPGKSFKRVVPCPTEYLPSGFSTDSEGPDGTLEVDCRGDIEALCEELDIKCMTNEVPNCAVTLPIEVECD
jgi:hypothetical protein